MLVGGIGLGTVGRREGGLSLGGEVGGRGADRSGATSAMKVHRAPHKGFDSTRMDVGREACEGGQTGVAGKMLCNR